MLYGRAPPPNVGHLGREHGRGAVRKHAVLDAGHEGLVECLAVSSRCQVLQGGALALFVGLQSLGLDASVRIQPVQILQIPVSD